MLPAVQFLQKSIQRHLDDVSKLYVLPAWLAGRAGVAPSPAGSTWGAAPRWDSRWASFRRGRELKRERCPSESSGHREPGVSGAVFGARGQVSPLHLQRRVLCPCGCLPSVRRQRPVLSLTAFSVFRSLEQGLPPGGFSSESPDHPLGRRGGVGGLRQFCHVPGRACSLLRPP